MEDLSVISSVQYRSGRLSVDGRMLCDSSASSTEAIINAYRAQGIDHPKFFKMDPNAQLAVVAVEPLFQRIAQLPDLDRDRIGLVHLSRHGSLEIDAHYWNTYTSEHLASPAAFVYTLPNIALGEVGIRHRLHGASFCLLSDAPRTDLLLAAAEQMIAQEGMRHVVCGWSDIFAGRATATFLLVSTNVGQTWREEEIERLFNDERN